jgi:hypothetical protein
MEKAVQPERLHIILSMHVACWITKAADIHSEYVILIAFPRQEWFCERTVMLRYTYIVCHVYFLHVNGQYIVIELKDTNCERG